MAVPKTFYFDHSPQSDKYSPEWASMSPSEKLEWAEHQVKNIAIPIEFSAQYHGHSVEYIRSMWLKYVETNRVIPVVEHGIGASKPMSLEPKSDPSLAKKLPNILDEAATIISGDREQTYGHPDANLTVIAGMWSAYLSSPITVNDVCVMMVLLKAARLKNSPEHRDSLVDLCGYAALMERVQIYRKEREPKQSNPNQT